MKSTGAEQGTAPQKALPEAFLCRMRGQLGEGGYARYLAAMARPPRRALRVNTQKIDADALFALLALPEWQGFSGVAPVPCGTAAEGFFVPADFAPGHHPLHAAGLFYMQEPSAQMPAPLLAVTPGETVLDLCAAPGGKAGQLAATLKNTGLLIANEPVPGRAAVLSGTLERLGVRNAVVTQMYPDALCKKLAGLCDAVLVDAPCSGEGMFRRDPQAVADWSEAHVTACAARQRSILSAAAEAVRPGGRLVYSTCTFSPAENEETVSAFLLENPDFHLASARRIYPQDGQGEGQFAALLLRQGGPGEATAGAARCPKPASMRVPAFDTFWAETMAAPCEFPVRLLKDGRVLLLPSRMPPDENGLHILRAGVLAGEVKSGRFQPRTRCFSRSRARRSGRPRTFPGAAFPPFLRAKPCPAIQRLPAMCPCARPAIRWALARPFPARSKTIYPRGSEFAEFRAPPAQSMI